MAANLDKAESSLTAVSDIAYVRAIDSSGNSVRISKADLASVLGVIPRNYFSLNEDLNEIKTNCLKTTTSTAISTSLLNKPNGLDVGNFMLFVIKDISSTFILQFFFGGNKIWHRTFYNSWLP